MTTRHTLGCMLARVAGRSPLEYLSDFERERQEEFVLDAMKGDGSSMPALIDTIATAAGCA